MLIKKEHWRILQNAKEISGELQHASMASNIDKKRIRNAVRKTRIVRRKKTLLKDLKIRRQFEEKVIEIVAVGAPYL